MQGSDYVQLILALALYPVVRTLVLGYPRLTDEVFYPPSDMRGQALEATMRRLERRFGSRFVPPLALTALSLAGWSSLGWTAADPSGACRTLAGVFAAIVAWKCATLDIDLVVGRAQAAERIGMLLAALATWMYPGFLVPVIFLGINRLRGWRHHQHIVIHSLISLLASWTAYALVGGFRGRMEPMTAPALVLVLIVVGSHYFVPGFRKLRMRPRYTGWVFGNRLHCLMVASYIWGWCSFLGDERAARIARFLRPFDRPFQMLALLFELGAGAILFHPALAYGFIVSGLIFHAACFVLAGILFWQNLAALATLGVVLYGLPGAVGDAVFGLYPGLIGLACMVLSNRDFIWMPKPLAWYDTPLACRAHWILEGRSGKRYWLDNAFMEPHDRIFGNKWPHLLSMRPRLSFHAGATKSRAQFDAILVAGADRERLDAAAAEHGQVAGSDALTAAHDEYLTTFFRRFNSGCRKHVCPRILHAPGFLYTRGEYPVFRGQEPVARVHLVEREAMFDGTRIVRFGETAQRTLEI